MLAQNGYLKSDGLLPVSRDPYLVGEKNLEVLSDIINGNVGYRLPIVYVSKLYDGNSPVNAGLLASKLKGGRACSSAARPLAEQPAAGSVS